MFCLSHKKLRHAYRYIWANSESSNASMAQEVLQDLARFCLSQQTSFVPNDPTNTAFNEGKRAVWLRINHFLNGKNDPNLILFNHELIREEYDDTIG